MATPERDVEHFSHRARHYERSRLQKYIGKIHDTMIASVAAAAPAPEAVLDVGCGTGRFLRKAAQRWPEARLTGVDPAEGMIAEARWKLSGATLLVATAESLPVPPESFDLAVSSLSIHHWADAEAGIAAMAGSLRPGGILCLADITTPRWLAAVLRSRAKSVPELRAFVERAGLQIRSERRVLARFVLVLTARRPEAAA